MPVFTALLLFLSIGIFVGTRPWSEKSSEYATVVATVASVAAFGGVLFTLLVLPLQAANRMGAGYMAELLYRPGVWLVGVWLVGVAASLFALAAINPDRDATIAAGLLGASALGLVWIAARRIVGSSDPQSLARRQADFLRKGSANSRRFTRHEMARSLKKQLRGTPIEDLVVIEEERTILNGFLRQFRAGVTGSIAERQVVAAINLWDGALETFRDFVRERDGAVGESSGVTTTLLRIADQLVMQGLALPADDEAVYTIGTLERLFESAPSNPEFSVVRSLTTARLQKWVEASWKHDETQVPAAALEALGRILRRFMQAGDFEDVNRTLRLLGELSTQAVADSRIHISTTGFQEMVKALAAFLTVGDDGERSYYLKSWVSVGRDFPLLRAMEAKESFRRGTEAIYPGINIWGVGIQETMAAAAGNPEVSSDLATHLLGWIRHSLEVFSATKFGGSFLAQDGLALLYCLALTQAFSVATTGEARWATAENIAGTALSWVTRLPDDKVAEVLFEENIAELLWSVMLTSSFVAQSGEILSKASAGLVDRLRSALEEAEPLDDSYVVEVVMGLLIAADQPEDSVERFRQALLGTDPFGIYRGIHIDPIGRVPGVNQNMAAVANSGLYEAINKWALETFPRFR